MHDCGSFPPFCNISLIQVSRQIPVVFLTFLTSNMADLFAGRPFSTCGSQGHQAKKRRNERITHARPPKGFYWFFFLQPLNSAPFFSILTIKVCLLHSALQHAHW